ncbi:Zn-dependent hydrolase [Hyphomicrobium sulfonivorans]|uniref:Zn-dependent hydrolase n=1 Tax=Hyphomicrobium sulfonivorans TaxID=121290 RepID=A0A109BKQ3_HYPSL|nr:quinoprotein relay system zinc metallohydrolase 2 [Hyphomicrobium sulfonivorans]KWT70524.1 Zn-dependent hydrolase [Hyphomicrobium sulfonivorans]
MVPPARTRNEEVAFVGTGPEQEAFSLWPRHRLPGLTRRELLIAGMAISSVPLWGHFPALAAEPMAFSEIAPGVYVHTGRHELQSADNRGDMSNAGFIVGDDAVAVIDTLGSAQVGADMRAAIKATTDKPIRYVINTHMHPDHVFGNAAFRDDKPEFVAHHKMGRGLSARAETYLNNTKSALGEAAFAGTEIVLPTLEVQDKLTLDLGGRELVLEAQPAAHTDNDLIVTDAKTGTMFLGDLLFSEHIPTLDGSLRGWLTVIDKLESSPSARVVPGHGPASMEIPAALADEKRYWQTVAGDVRKLIAEGKTLSDATKTAGQSERGKWEMFDQYHVRNVTAAFAELEWE